MKIRNLTNWNTKQFGAFIRRVAEREHMTDEQMDKLCVTIKYRKRSCRWRDDQTNGCARLDGTYMRLNVVKGVQVDKSDLAHTIAHELAHCQGVGHRNMMSGSRYGWKNGHREVWAWANELPLTMNADPVKAKPSGVDLASKKLQHCQDQLLVWQKKMKMAQTKLRKWRQKAKYYEGRLAAIGPAHVEAVEQVAQVMAIMEGKQCTQ